jgi:hypothetical protein
LIDAWASEGKILAQNIFKDAFNDTAYSFRCEGARAFTNEAHKLILGLIFHIKGVPAIMMVIHPAPKILCNKSQGCRLIFDFILILHSEGAQASRTIFTSFKISFHFCGDRRICCEGEWQVKDDGYAIVKQ